jgi:hypothetical protein
MMETHKIIWARWRIQARSYDIGLNTQGPVWDQCIHRTYFYQGDSPLIPSNLDFTVLATRLSSRFQWNYMRKSRVMESSL